MLSTKSKVCLCIAALLQVLLIVLKACGVISCSWAIVFMPAILFVSLMAMFVIFCIFTVITNINEDE